eukprot:scaffold324526_cov45-Prasinocladus_malaysianus.AAC.1
MAQATRFTFQQPRPDHSAVMSIPPSWPNAFHRLMHGIVFLHVMRVVPHLFFYYIQGAITQLITVSKIVLSKFHQARSAPGRCSKY